ncbi:NfeD family protein [Roseofilum casamattae]|uniref:NfeD family protein n=1 Tax=Roseofilum casamattae BLCC-M143 TaxID=3022442 RepID=A0ABT7C305_9CYAN|nr:NfeD family protein [Roseofilum casamattae]MDJ1185833.1 NfeD family protein [Roseofilum casamattae BLCC-M143]
MTSFSSPNPRIAFLSFLDQMRDSVQQPLEPETSRLPDPKSFPGTCSDPVVPIEGEATVDQTVLPYQRGRVYFQGSWWPATSREEFPLVTDQVVKVIARQNITLLVTTMTVHRAKPCP